MSKKVKLEEVRAELINDLVATATVMEELWNYHPDNPDKKDVVKEYDVLKKIQKDIEQEIAELDK
jgi:cell division protein FtsB|tara:strand:+ start:129 stop:323 length:195 start_codon:yes stop_codon:yes gene_type:complete